MKKRGINFRRWVDFYRIIFLSGLLLLIAFSVFSEQSLVPAITNLSHSSVCPDATVTITGTNFQDVTSVKIEGGAALTFNIDADTAITVTLPSVIPSRFKIEVTSLGGAVVSSELSSTTNGSSVSSLRPPRVSMDGSPVGRTKTICGEEILNLGIEDPDNISGVNFSWISTASANVVGSSNGTGSAIGDTLMVTSGGNGTVEYNITSTFITPCGLVFTSLKQVQVIVNATPAVTIPSATPEYCSGSQLDISLAVSPASAGNAHWSLKGTLPTDVTVSPTSGTSNKVLNPTVTNNTTANVMITFTIEIPGTTGLCQRSVNQEINVIINPSKAVSLDKPRARGSKKICSNGTLSLTLTDPNNTPGVSYAWTTTGGVDVTGFSSGSGSMISQQLTYTGTGTQGTLNYVITSTVNQCISGNTSTNTRTVPVIVYKSPSVRVQASPSSICNGNTLNLTFTPSTGASVKWKLKSPVQGISIETQSGTSVTEGQGDLNHIITNSTSNKKSITFVVTPEMNSCEGVEEEVSVVVEPNYSSLLALRSPKISNVTNNKIVICSGSPLNLGITDPGNISGVTFSWTSIADANITGSSQGTGASSITDTLLLSSGRRGNVKYSIKSTFTKPCGGGVLESSPRVITVTVNPIPSVQIPTSKEYCSGSPLGISLAVSPSAAGNADWSLKGTLPTDVSIDVASGNDVTTLNPTLTNNTSSNVNITFTIDISGMVNACKRTVAQEITVIIKPATTFALAKPTVSGSRSICSKGIVSLMISDPNSTPGVTYSWTTRGGTDVTGFAVGNGDTISQKLTYTGTGTKGTVTYVIRGSVDQCSSSGSTSTSTRRVSVEVYKPPTVTIPSGALSVCSGKALNLTFRPSTGASVKWELKSAVPGISIETGSGTSVTEGQGNVNNIVKNSSTSQEQTIIFVVTPAVKGCEGKSKEVSVVVEPNYTPVTLRSPKVSNVTNNKIAICSGSPLNLGITDPDNNNGVVFSWTSTATGSDITGNTASSTASKITDTLSYTGSTSTTVTYIVKSELKRCGNSDQEKTRMISVDVYAEPTVSVPSDKVICRGDVLSLDFMPSSNARVSWRLKAPVTELTLGSTSGTGDISNLSVSYVGTTDTKFIIVVTPALGTSGGCQGRSKEVEVGIHVPIVLDTEITGDLEICTGAALDVSLSDKSYGGTDILYSWTATGGADVRGFTSTGSVRKIGDTLTYSGMGTYGEVTYVIKSVLSNPCSPTNYEQIKTIKVKVYPKPVITSSFGSVNVNSGGNLSFSNIVLSPSTATVKWALKASVIGVSLSSTSGTGNISETVTNVETTEKTIIIVFTPVNGGSCEGTPKEVSVAVAGRIVAPVLLAPTLTPSSAAICSGEQVRIGISDPSSNSNVSFSWTASSSDVTGFSSSGTTTSINDTLTLSSGISQGSVTYVVTSSLSTASKMTSVTIQVNGLPTVVVPSAQMVCTGETLSLDFTPSMGSTLNWELSSLVNDVTIATQGTGDFRGVVTNTSAEVKQVSIIVTPTDSQTSCKGLPQSVDIEIFPALSPPIIKGVTSVCEGDEIALSLSSNVPGATFSWVVLNRRNVEGANGSTGGSSIVSDILTLASGTNEGTVTYQVTSTLSGICTTTPITTTKDIEVIVTAKPILNAIEDEFIVCDGDNITVALSGSPGTIQSWRVVRPNGGIILGNMTGTGDLDMSYTQVNVANKDIKSILFAAKSTNTSATGCLSSDESFFSVKIMPPLKAPVIYNSSNQVIMKDATTGFTNVEVCSGTRLNLIIADPDQNPDVYFEWRATAVQGVLGGTVVDKKGFVINDLLTKMGDTNVVSSLEYIITPVLKGCKGLSRTVTVTVTSKPTVTFGSTSSVVNGEVNICVKSGLDIELSNSLGETVTYNWRVNTVSASGIFQNITRIGTGTGTNENIIELATNLAHNNLTTESITYRITATSASGCEGPAQYLKVNVHPQPKSITFEGLQEFTCSGEQFTFRANVGARTSWAIKIETLAVVGSTVTGQQSLNKVNFSGTISDVLVNTTDTIQTVKYRVTALAPPNNACTNIVVEKSVKVYPQPKFLIASPKIACPTMSRFPLTIKNEVNVDLSTLTWKRVDENGVVIAINPMIKKAGNDWYYELPTAVPGNKEVLVKLKAFISTSQDSCQMVDKEFSFRILAVPNLDLEYTSSSSVVTNKSAGFTLKVQDAYNSNVTLAISPKTKNISSQIDLLRAGNVFYPEFVTVDTDVIINAEYTFPEINSNCTFTQEFTIPVYIVPNVTIHNTTIDYCKNSDQTPTLSASPIRDDYVNGRQIIDAIWSGKGIINASSKDAAKLNISELDQGDHIVKYTVTDDLGVSNSKIITFTLHPLPAQPGFTTEILCFRQGKFTNTILDAEKKDPSLINTDLDAAIVRWKWTFGDGSTLESTDPLSEESIVYHDYTSPGTYTVILEGETRNGCLNSVLNRITIPDFVIVDFDVEGLCVGESIKFIDKSYKGSDTSSTLSEANIYTWNFGDGSPLLSGRNTNDEIRNPSYTYTGPGRYTVTLTVGNLNCNISKTYNIDVHKVVSPTVSDSYNEDFEFDDGGWIPGQALTSSGVSWAHGVPTGSEITATSDGSRIWATNLYGAYKAGEKSWLTSPCIDLDSNNIPVPQLSMDLFVNTVAKVSGSVVEISYDYGASWNLLGSSTSNEDKIASNWYDETGIVGQLASTGSVENSNKGQIGWSGEYEGMWRNIVFDLDAEFRNRNVINRKVMFRVLFGSPNDDAVLDYYGVGFDNVSIASKSQDVLMETFVNYNNPADLTRSIFSVSEDNTQLSDKVLQINYHINSRGGDQFNIDNPIPPSVRRLYYGIENQPYYVINGRVILLDPDDPKKLSKAISEAGLVQDKLKMTTEISDNAKDNGIRIKVNVAVGHVKDVKRFETGDYILHIVVTQPMITALPNREPNGTTYYNVMKEMLPNVEGTQLEYVDNTQSFEPVELVYYPKDNIYPENALKIIAFVQDQATKAVEILSSADRLNVTTSDIILGLQDDSFYTGANSNEEISIYPVPFKEGLTIDLPAGLSRYRQEANIVLIDMLGKQYFLPKQVYNNTIVLDSTMLPSGTYAVYIRVNDVNVIKKVSKSK